MCCKSHVYTSVYLYIYTHISTACCWEGMRQRIEHEKGSMDEEGVGNGLLQSE